MDDDKRRHLHQLIERAVNKDSVACLTIEQMILDFERQGPLTTQLLRWKYWHAWLPSMSIKRSCLGCQGVIPMCGGLPSSDDGAHFDREERLKRGERGCS